MRRQIEIRSPLSVEEVHLRIAGAIGDGAGFFRSSREYPFKGSVDSRGCELISRGGGRDLQKPVLDLAFSVDSHSGTALIGEIRPQRGFVVFQIIWFSLIGIFAVFGAWNWFFGAKDDSSVQFAVQPWGMLIFGVILMAGIRWWSGLQAESMVAELVELVDGELVGL